MENPREPIPQPAPGGTPCGLGRRLLAMGYDTVAVLALMMLATALVMAAGFREVDVAHDPPYAAALLLTWFLYLAWCWRRGMTLGMRAWRIRIERAGGELPRWRDCALRFPASLLSAAALGLGFWWSLFDGQKRCWHDTLSNTRLVRKM